MIENLTVAHISLGGFPAFTCSGTFSQSLGESASNQTGLVFPKTLLTVPRYPLIHKRYWQLSEIRVHVLELEWHNAYIDYDKITYGRLLYGKRCLWNFSLWASTTTMDNKTQTILACIFNSYVQPILYVMINVSIFISQLGIWKRLSRLKFDTSVKYVMMCNIRSIMP